MDNFTTEALARLQAQLRETEVEAFLAADRGEPYARQEGEAAILRQVVAELPALTG